MTAASWEKRGEAAATAALYAMRRGEAPTFTPPEGAEEHERRWWRNGWNKRLAGGDRGETT